MGCESLSVGDQTEANSVFGRRKASGIAVLASYMTEVKKPQRKIVTGQYLLSVKYTFFLELRPFELLKTQLIRPPTRYTGDLVKTKVIQ